MSEDRVTFDDEIDLFELFATLWRGKWKIIATTFIAGFFGGVFSITKPASFEGSIPVQPATAVTFLQYKPLNDLLAREGFPLAIDEDIIFQRFIVEFNDYQEMMAALSSSEYVQTAIQDMDETRKQMELIRLAKSFVLHAPATNEETGTLSFQWHDHFEGIRLFDDAIHRTLENVKQATLENIDNSARVVDARSAARLEALEGELKDIGMLQDAYNAQRALFLEEQLAIARELGIEGNALEEITIVEEPSSVVVPYYLRGSIAIDKEIALLRSRSAEDNLLSAGRYLDTQANIISINSDPAPSQLRSAKAMMQSEDPAGWIKFDLTLANVKSQKKPLQYIAISIILGAMMGVVQVLISSAIRNHGVATK